MKNMNQDEGISNSEEREEPSVLTNDQKTIVLESLIEDIDNQEESSPYYVLGYN